jgi:hypothetical protein
MEFNYSYKGNSGVSESGGNTQMSFSPDTKRPPTYFIGELRQNVAFREAISALHDVVVSDMRFQPKDKTDSCLTVDADERIIQAECSCNWHQQNKLYKGPCEHILALRMQYSRQCQ